MRDLNSLIDPTAGGWTLTSAAAINNVEQITGYANRIVIVDDQYLMVESTAFLLTPVPEPSTFALAVLGIAGLMILR